MQITAESNLLQLKKEMNRLGGRSSVVLGRSMSKALGKANTQAKRIIADKRNLKVGYVGQRLKVYKSNGRNMVVGIRSRSRPIPLIKVKSKPRQNRKGVRIRTQRGRSTLLRSSFIATMPTGHTGIYRRTGRKTSSGKSQIVEHYVPSVAATLVDDQVVEVVNKTFRRSFIPAYRHQMHREIERIQSTMQRTSVI